MKKKKMPELADDQMCFGCGRKNDRGLGLTFELDSHPRRLRTRWTPTKEFQGYADIVHGGMIGLVLDELMVNLLWVLKLPAVTAELKLRLHRPAGVGEPLDSAASIKADKSRLYQMEAEARTVQGELVATASAQCVKVRRKEK
jgi:acyl-coenzyme A thioesterase PaaI-like protein